MDKTIKLLTNTFEHFLYKHTIRLECDFVELSNIDDVVWQWTISIKNDKYLNIEKFYEYKKTLSDLEIETFPKFSDAFNHKNTINLPNDIFESKDLVKPQKHIHELKTINQLKKDGFEITHSHGKIFAKTNLLSLYKILDTYRCKKFIKKYISIYKFNILKDSNKSEWELFIHPRGDEESDDFYNCESNGCDIANIYQYHVRVNTYISKYYYEDLVNLGFMERKIKSLNLYNTDPTTPDKYYDILSKTLCSLFL